MPITKILTDDEGNEYHKYFCFKCSKYRKRERFAPDEKFRIQICSDCYARDHKEDLDEFIEVYQQFYELSKIPQDILKQELGTHYKDIYNVLVKLELIESSDEDVCEAELISNSV